VADPATYRPTPGSVPDSPGVYRFRDERSRVIYVGKAKSLRARLGSYFQDLTNLHPRTQQMVTSAASVEWTVVGTEVEALQLEYSWIKEFDPRFNVRYRDDKSYPSLAVTLHEEFPRLLVMRGPKRKGVRYFGPYAHAWAIRETLDLLLRVFPARTCSNGVFRRATQVGRPCLLGYIGKCSAPCVGRVDAAEHRAIVEDFCTFMAGQTAPFIRRLEKQMRAAAADTDFERAARLRDDIKALERAMEKNAVVFGDGTDADVVAIAQDALEAAVQVFHVRGGRIRGQRGLVVDKVENLSTGELVEQFLLQFYGGVQFYGGADVTDAAAPDEAPTGPGESVPREVLVPALPADCEAVALWLGRLRGARVDLRVPQRGDKRALLETVERNAAQALALHKTRRSSDLTTRSIALSDLQDALELDEAPLRIECFDVSQLQGTDVVASMVVFEDGLARKSEYRRFIVRGRSGHGDPRDDTEAMHEVISRRFRRYLEERFAEPAVADEVGSGVPGVGPPGVDLPGIDPDTGRPRRFAYPPNLVVVDGGRPQVNAAARAMRELGIDDVALCGLAKRLEEVWLPGQDHPVVLPRSGEGLYLLQRVRDEAHRFAIAHHRARRSKRMTTSGLDVVPGLGETRRAALLRRFGSLKKVASASVEEIAKVPGIGPRTAEAIVQALRSPRDVAGAAAEKDGAETALPAVNTATGEIMDDVEGADRAGDRLSADAGERGGVR